MPAESSILKGERVGGKGRRARERKRREQHDKREEKGEKKEKAEKDKMAEKGERKARPGAHVLCYPFFGVDLTFFLGWFNPFVSNKKNKNVFVAIDPLTTRKTVL